MSLTQERRISSQERRQSLPQGSARQIQSITNPSSGSPCQAHLGLFCKEISGVLKVFLEYVICDAVTYTGAPAAGARPWTSIVRGGRQACDAARLPTALRVPCT